MMALTAVSASHVRNACPRSRWAVFPARGADDARHGLDKQILPRPVARVAPSGRTQTRNSTPDAG
jgi:hypothetical protein